MGGGTICTVILTVSSRGLSPRGRGNRLFAKASSLCMGSIPAWAGEPLPCSVASIRRQVYPRVGGGTQIRSNTCRHYWVYPRVGGGTNSSSWISLAFSGLSPRGRGNPAQFTRLQPCQGSIPAWAGEPSHRGEPRSFQGVYPRVGGGTPLLFARLRPVEGLSPRGRGNQPTVTHTPQVVGSIPAWAGEPEWGSRVGVGARVYPRVGGGTPLNRHNFS